MKDDRYFIGLDIGTDSVGWAVTDPSYNIIKKNGKALWGIRLFDTASGKAERRLFRTARRRLERRRQRLDWLQSFFSEAMGAVDPAFFLRLKESKFCEEDKRDEEGQAFPGRYTLFADPGYCDVDYHREYPTIYHLRQALITEDRPFDVRLLYLALHHIMKYRGHFLFGEMDLEDVTFDYCLSQLNEYLLEEMGFELVLTDPAAFVLALCDRSLRVREKEAALTNSSDSQGPPALKAILQLLAGRKVKLADLYGEDSVEDTSEKFTLKEDFDAQEEKVFQVVGERILLLQHVKRIYDWALLDALKNGKRTLSEGKIAVYETHKKDLQLLKKVLKPYPALYREMFRARGKKNNYVSYSGHGAPDKRCDAADFGKFLKSTLAKVAPCEEVTAILEMVELGAFLPKQTSKDNGVIPHQIHEQELSMILKNQGAYHGFLNEADESGLALSQRILAMFRFRIPYSVGPLDSRSPHAWVARTGEKIYPWNFEQVVDLDKCTERFIRRMTAKCTYTGKDILPQPSLLYSRFSVLNELNNLKVNGKPIPVDLKQDIYNDLFSAGRKVRQRDLANYLSSRGWLQQGDEISGIDGDFKSTLAPYAAFSKLLEDPGNADMVEDIIAHIVLFGDDRKLLKRWLKKTYAHRLSEEDLSSILAKRFTGWGRLSREFLTEIQSALPEIPEPLSIIDALWHTNYNLMELLSLRFGFGAALEAYRSEYLKEQGYTLEAYLQESYAPPAIRRSIHQTIQIIGEIEKIMKDTPARVFVEVAREDGVKGDAGRKRSRKAELLELYRQCDRECDALMAELDSREEHSLRRDKLYFYYAQCGKCMYSGEPIQLDTLDQDYDIDHIYPQSKTKDDSLDNRVLVKRELNAKKEDEYPIAKDIRDRMRPFWSELKRRGFISAKKFDRLVRSTSFGEEELAGFINRQLVETRQSTKLVAELLKRRYEGGAEIVYVKAGNVSSFRQDQRILLSDDTQKQAWECKNQESWQDPLFVKCREVNDLHHAKDAYLNIVVGNVYHVKFTANPLNLFRKSAVSYSLNRMFDFDVERNGERAWISGEGNSIAVVRRMMAKNNVLFTRQAIDAGGGFYKQTILPKGKGEAPIKSSDSRMSIEKFGGYTERKGRHFFLAEHGGKSKKRSIECVLHMYHSLYERDPLAYCRDILGLEEPRILIPCIKFNALIQTRGTRLHISGRQNNAILFKNGVQLILSPEMSAYIKQLLKLLDGRASGLGDEVILKYYRVSREGNRALYDHLVEKLKAPCFGGFFLKNAEMLHQAADTFSALDLVAQSGLIAEVLKMTACNAGRANLEAVGGAKGTGVLKITKNLPKAGKEEFFLIHQSVTGFFEKKVDLLGDAF